MGSIYAFYCVCFHLSVLLLFFSLGSSSISLELSSLTSMTPERVSVYFPSLLNHRVRASRFATRSITSATAPLESETPLADCTTTFSPSNDSVTQSLRLSTGGNMEVTYYIVNGFKLKFSINVTGDGPYSTPYKEIFSSIVSSTPITNSNFTASPDFATVYLYIDAMYFSLTYSQPTVANFSDVPQTGVGFSYGPIYNNNDTLSLGIAASWNKTWYYDPNISAAFGGLGMKDGGGGGSGSDGDDGYIALYMVLPCVTIISV